ncbi:SbmA/BacA-like family transporter, partial [Aphanothece microscopica]|uniref:SbmA/BacA-like family transporter n=1 Tax=Aphanothece microscopica TaxID=1049561 RepID=UPI0039855149
MFLSFFPSPRLFFTSVALWTLFAVLLWFFLAKDLGYLIGLENPPEGSPPIIGISVFWSKPFLWFYVYYALAVSIFAGVWRVLSPQPWFYWSVLGTALIVFVIYFQVQVSVAINAWYGPFWDLVQAAVSKSKPVTLPEFYAQILTFFSIASVAVTVIALNNF